MLRAWYGDDTDSVVFELNIGAGVGWRLMSDRLRLREPLGVAAAMP